MNPQQPTYIQLDNAEDAASIRDRLSFIRGKHVLLIWPEKGTALTRKLDLVLIQREARRRVLQLALVTHDADVIKHAEELGISTFETIKDAESSRWKRGRTRVFVNRYHKPEDTPEPDDLMPVASRVRKPRKRIPPVLRLSLQLTVFVLVVIVILTTLYITIPSATVRFAMDQELIQVQTTIIADHTATDIDIENRVIPATRFEATVQTLQQIPTTGIEPGSSTNASGTISLTNTTSQPVTVPAGTQIRTSTGQPVFFETTAEVTIPANDSLEGVAIAATSEFVGELGNVPSRTINTVVGALNNDLTITNNLPTVGGTDNSIQTVALEDVEFLMGSTRQYLQGLGYTQIEAGLSEQQIIILESVRIPEERLRSDWINFSHDIGDRTDLLTLDMRVVVEALAIDDRLAQQVVFAQISAEKPDDMVLNPNSFLFLRGSVIETDENYRTTFEASGEGIASAQVDIYRLQADLTRRPLNEAQRLIAATVDIAPNSQPQIEISPSWLNHMPFLPIRINIEIEGQP